MSFNLSTSSTDAADKYRDAFSDVFEADVDSAGFYCRSAKVHLGDVIVSRARMSGQVFRRTRSLTRRNGIDAVQIICDISGDWRGTYDDRSASGGPGSVRFVDTARPFVTNSKAFETIALVVPRRALGDAWANRDLHGLVLPPSASTRLLMAHAQTLWDEAGTLTPAEAAAGSEAAAVLARGMISGVSWIESGPPTSMRRTIFARCRDYIDAHLTDGNLTPATICSRVGVSPRTLYRAFQEHGGVAAYIQGRRLDRAYEVIRSSDHRVRSLAEIADAHGFPSNAHFSRAFRARFGFPPGEVRRRQAARDSSPPAAATAFGATYVDWCQNL